MQRPHMSTGAWIFATAALVLAVGAPISYAAVNSTVAIGNTTNSTTASVTASHQLLTTTIAPKNVVEARGVAAIENCGTVYIPPAGKAIVVLTVTYETFGASSNGGYLEDATCGGGVYDAVETDQHVTYQHTFPAGLPMPSVGLLPDAGSYISATITGYLIPFNQLPGAAPAPNPVSQRTASKRP